MADPNINFDQTMDAVTQNLAQPQQVVESDSQYAHCMRAMEHLKTDILVDMLCPGSSMSTSTTLRSSGRTAGSTASVLAWRQEVLKRGVLQTMHNGHMMLYNTSTVPIQDVVLEMKVGISVAHIPSKPTIKIKIPSLDNASCAPFIALYPSPNWELEEWMGKDAPDQATASLVVPVVPEVKVPEEAETIVEDAPATPVEQTQKETETVWERMKRERKQAAAIAHAKYSDIPQPDNLKVDEAHTEAQTLIPEKPPVPLSDMFG